LVRWKSWGKWLVDEVTAEGVTQYGGQISLTLEKERVSRTTWRTMNAEPCNAIGTAEVGGLRWKIGPHISQTGVKSFFPKCQVVATGLGIFQYIAEPVTAEGTLMSN
jgi:hypothetical protein